MGFLSRLSAAVAAFQGKMSPEEWLEEYGSPSRSSTGLAVNQHTSLRVTTALACTQVLSEDVAKLPVHLYKLVNGARKIVEDNPLERLLRHPNDWQTRFEFIEMLMCSLVLRGNAYAVIVRDHRGIPLYMVPINPDRVWIFEAPDGQVFYQVARRGMHEIAKLASLPLMIAAEDMLHVRWMAQESSLWGIGRVQQAAEAFGLSLAQQELAARLAGNNANLGGTLQTDKKLSQEAYDRVKTNWQKNYGGLHNAGKTAILEEGLKWQPLGMTSVDAEFLNSRKFSVEEIARIFRVPLYKIGVESARVTGTSLVQLDQEYLNSTLSSYCERISLKLEQTFGIGDDMFIGFDYSDFLKADIMTRLTAKRIGVVGMIYTPNEARAGEGLAPVDGGDTLYQPTNVAPIGFDPSAQGVEQQPGPGSDTSGEPAPGGMGDPASVPDQAPSV